jgi:hypothetical protein
MVRDRSHVTGLSQSLLVYLGKHNLGMRVIISAPMYTSVNIKSNQLWYIVNSPI